MRASRSPLSAQRLPRGQSWAMDLPASTLKWSLFSKTQRNYRGLCRLHRVVLFSAIRVLLRAKARLTFGNFHCQFSSREEADNRRTAGQLQTEDTLHELFCSCIVCIVHPPQAVGHTNEDGSDVMSCLHLHPVLNENQGLLLAFVRAVNLSKDIDWRVWPCCFPLYLSIINENVWELK